MPLPQIRTVAEVLDWYLETAEASFTPASRRDRLSILARFRAALGDKLVKACGPEDLAAFIEAQPGIRSNWTRLRFKKTVNAPFNQAARKCLIARNPFLGLKVPEGQHRRYLQANDYRALLRGSSPHFRRFVLFLFLTRMPPSMARALQWADVRFDRGAILLPARRVVLGRVLAKLLEWIRRNNPDPTFVFTTAWNKPWSRFAFFRRRRRAERSTNHA